MKPIKKNLVFLFVGVLAFARGPLQVWFLGGVFAVWGIGTLTRALRRYWPRFRALRGNKRPPSQEVYSPADPISAALLRHVNCRISAYLQSAYPSVTWEWHTKNPEKLVVENGIGRIKLFGIPDFNYADISFDRLARLGCDMLRIVPLAEVRNADVPKMPKPGQPVDPEVWYGIQGKRILEACVAKLNSHGYSSLLIRENGDICCRQADSEVVRDKFKNLPGKGVWKALVKVIESHGFSAAVAGDCIQVSW
jgi:hypothetical protein